MTFTPEANSTKTIDQMALFAIRVTLGNALHGLLIPLSQLRLIGA